MVSCSDPSSPEEFPRPGARGDGPDPPVPGDLRPSDSEAGDSGLGFAASGDSGLGQTASRDFGIGVAASGDSGLGVVASGDSALADAASADPDAGDQAPADPEPGQLLDQVLNSLLVDFEDTFARGLQLLAHCPDRVLPAEGRTALQQRLLEARAGLSAARALRAAAPTPMALDMATIQPWHGLVVEVWSLSASMRAAGVVLP